MSLNIQKAHTKRLWRQRRQNFAAALVTMFKMETSTVAVIHTATMHANATTELLLLDARTKEINDTSFAFNFGNLTDLACVQLFRFKRDAILLIVSLVGWPVQKTRTTMNGYKADPLMATCIVLRRMATADRWCDLELLFGKHAPQLSELCREALKTFMDKSGDLVTAPIPSSFMAHHAQRYASAVFMKNSCMEHTVGFIDGTVIGVARPGGSYMMQLVLYNGHKRKHAIKFQAVTTPDGLCIHLHGPEVGRRHDMYLYAASGVNENFEEIMDIDGKKYHIFGDSGYSWRVFLEVPYSGANVTVAQRAFNHAMSKVRITVEWFFMEVKRLWGLTDAKRKMRVGEMPAGLIYRAAVVLTNLRNCVSPNIISQYFECAPPTIEEYICLRRDESD